MPAALRAGSHSGMPRPLPRATNNVAWKSYAAVVEVHAAYYSCEQRCTCGTAGPTGAYALRDPSEPYCSCLADLPDFLRNLPRELLILLGRNSINGTPDLRSRRHRWCIPKRLDARRESPEIRLQHTKKHPPARTAACSGLEIPDQALVVHCRIGKTCSALFRLKVRSNIYCADGSSQSITDVQEVPIC